MKWKPYPKYKDSGVDWLGEVPQHWTVAALAYRYEVALGKMLDDKQIVGDHLAPYLRNADVQWDRILTTNLPRMDFSTQDRHRFGLRPGDLLVCEGGEVGRAAIWSGELEECFYQKALHRLRAYRTSGDNGRFMLYVLWDSALKRRFTGCEGRSTIAHLTAEALRRYLFAFAPEPEQVQIAAYLDREAAKIDTLIAKQERLIELLQEKKQALISQVVTKGIAINAPMKLSRVEWLGDVPAHWRVTALKRVCDLITDGTHQPPQRTDEGYPLLSVRNLVGGRFINLPDDSHISEVEYRLLVKHFRVKSGDLVLAIVGATLGKAALVEDMPPFAIQRSLAVIRTKPGELLNRYLLYYIRSSFLQELLWRSVGFSAQPGIYLGDLANLPVPLPPHAEQVRIVERLESRLQLLDDLEYKAKQSIDLMREHRIAIISAAATGKIDVREPAHA